MNIDCEGVYRKTVKLIALCKKIIKPGCVSMGDLKSNTPKSLSFSSNHDYWVPANTPLISIVIPSYNQGMYLERTIKSVLEQKYPSLELIIVDGESVDCSKEIIKKYSASLSWWCSEPDDGQADAINKGIKHSQGALIAWLNADDCLVPGALAKVANFIGKRPDLAVVYGHRILIDENDFEIGRWILPPHSNEIMKWVDYIPQETLFWRRSAWEQVGGCLDQSFAFAMDWELLLRFRAAGVMIDRMPSFLGLFRVHADQKTASQMDSIGLEEIARLHKRYIGYLPSKKELRLRVLGYLIKARLLEIAWKIGLVKYR